MKRITDPNVQPFELEHIAAVRKAAAECTLFLAVNPADFPITPGKIALYGSGARKTIKGGTGSGDVNVRHFVTIEEGLEKAGFTLTSKSWLDAYDALKVQARIDFVEAVKKEAAELGINPIMYGMGKPMPEPEYEFPVDAAGDTAIYVLSRISGEGADRSTEAGDIDLTETEIRDILACSRKYPKFILVLNVGGMVNLEPVKEVENILLLGQLGTPIGDVLADILTGKSYPSGKLAMTWAAIDKYPSTEGFGDMDDTLYKEGIYVGYRYFDTAGVAPTYPFGYGLSLTSFSLEATAVSADEKQVSVTVKVTNTGSHAGKEVIQLYSSSPAGKLEKPVKELRAFSKTNELQPGESEEVTLTYDTCDMTSYAPETAAYLLEAGEYLLLVGNSSADTTVCTVLELDETAVIRQVKNICQGAEITPLSLTGVKPSFSSDCPRFALKASAFDAEIISYTKEFPEITNDVTCDFTDVLAGRASMDDFVAGLTNKELAYLCCGLHEENAGFGSMVGAASKSVAGAAGETTDILLAKGVPARVMSDGPAGIRVCTQYKVVGDTIKAMDNPLATMMDFMDPESLAMMAQMLRQPSEEEQAAPMNYTYCVAIPIGTALAQSFNLELCRAMGDIVGEEMEIFGIHIWLAPAMNIQRTPLCGRDFEYLSEDPTVSGLIAAAIDQGVRRHPGCGTSIKHFALNNQESNRVASNSIADERTIREIYLRNFEICLKNTTPATIMSSYNLVNGTHTNNSFELLTNVLRDEWKYDGFVMTDWYAVGDMMTTGAGRQNKHAAGDAAGCVAAGNDMTMPGMAADMDSILGSIDNPTAEHPITRGMLQNCAKHILKVIA